ncbi:hypothetical protein [Bradyrhizobium sp. CCBAU 51753]|uniref:hypothetical protein n=1 Tax=Bradyrhizobium sp. CCBAU 51753 TaxID=1325100 RepID=UPI001FEE40AA|nr:hypothetical protein [Bradyrhizobium sp. CCBAU 51753]
MSATAVSAALLAVAASYGARADDSASLLKAMTEYTAAQKSITATFDSDVEIITPDLQKNPVHQFRSVENGATRQAADQAHRRLRRCRSGL